MSDFTEPNLRKTVIYSVCLHLEPEDGFINVVSEFAAWINFKTNAALTPEAILSGRVDSTFPHNGLLTVEVKGAHPVDSSPTNLKAIYAHDDLKVAGRRWVTEVQVESSNDFDVRCEVNLFAEDEDQQAKAPRHSRPRLMVNLVESCRPVVGTPGLFVKPLTLATAEKFLHEVTQPSRPVPLVVVNTQAAFYPPLILDRLREQLIGLADVYQISHESEYVDLAQAIGKQYVCYGKAVRIIWPMADGESEPGSTLVLPHDRNGIARTAHEVERSIFHTVLHRLIRN
jgi:hypothetical protein